MCRIITGTGSHSSTGPILRSYFTKLFERVGCFYALEQINPGVVLFDVRGFWTGLAPLTSTDSKLVVQTRGGDNVSSPPQKKSSETSLPYVDTRYNNGDNLIGDKRVKFANNLRLPTIEDDPTPQEDAAFNLHLKRAQDESKHDFDNQELLKQKQIESEDDEFRRAAEANFVDNLAFLADDYNEEVSERREVK
jgi:hypothetical protein|tara:strand:+ start:430 stop:1008 length:579 start_codon:yes stop_codon:yes gene_type:complete